MCVNPSDDYSVREMKPKPLKLIWLSSPVSCREGILSLMWHFDDLTGWAYCIQRLTLTPFSTDCWELMESLTIVQIQADSVFLWKWKHLTWSEMQPVCAMSACIVNEKLRSCVANSMKAHLLLSLSQPGWPLEKISNNEKYTIIQWPQ